jgi:hypothetical protein
MKYLHHEIEEVQAYIFGKLEQKGEFWGGGGDENMGYRGEGFVVYVNSVAVSEGCERFTLSSPLSPPDKDIKFDTPLLLNTFTGFLHIQTALRARHTL